MRLPSSAEGKVKAVFARTTVFLFVLLICAVGGLFCNSYYAAVHSEAFRGSLTIVSTAVQVREILGDGIHQQAASFGHLESFQGSEFAEWSIPLAGGRGRGHLYGVANQVNGRWDYARLVFQTDDGGRRVDLTPVRALALQRVPDKIVYLVPIGLAESLDWAPSYYRSKLGITVKVLPSVSVDPKLIDATRSQVNAEKCIEDYFSRTYPDLFRDPSALIIGVTSEDIYIPSLDWSYAENLRRDGRFAVVSTYRLHPFALLERLNSEWLTSRLQKLLTKNVAMLYFNLPMSSDYTSMLSGGVLSGREIDLMGDDVIGEENQWNPFIDSGAPAVGIYDIAGKKPLWMRTLATSALPDTNVQVFSAGLEAGLLVQRKADFVFPDEAAMQFTRVYRNQDDRSRAFGIGGSDDFDIFLGGKMGVGVDLILADGTRIRFIHKGSVYGESGDVYLPRSESRRNFVKAVYSANLWHVATADGWIYEFPYRPDALPQYVTVLTGFTDPDHRRYRMKRDLSGALLEVTSPSGAWLHFENDSLHRIHRITSSTGRTVQYEYNTAGSLVLVTPSDGSADSYTYDEKGQMLTASHGTRDQALTNQFYVDGYIKGQTMQGGQSFEYHYSREGNILRNTYITDPNGLETYIQYEQDGYREWLPSALPR